jgi:uncharacterized BrkB/YihY/UPF0761 family membrane protein
MAALPVFLLWSFFSWLVILLGAQIAVSHERDAILVHGGDGAEAELAAAFEIGPPRRRRRRGPRRITAPYLLTAIDLRNSPRL